MDSKKLLLAIVLSFVVLFGYNILFVKKNPQPAPAVEQIQPVQAPEVKTPAAPGPEAKPLAASTTPAEKPAEKPQPGPKSAVSAAVRTKVSTSLFDAEWSNKGAVLVSWKLKTYKDEKGQPLEIVPKAGESGVYPFSLLDDAASVLAALDLPKLQADPLNASLYEASATEIVLKDGQRGELRFRFSDGQGLEAEKIFTFTGGRYDFQTAVRVLRNGQKAEPRILWGPGIGNPTEEDLKKSFGAGGGISIFAGGKVYRVDEGKFKPELSVINYPNWAAYDDNYFCVLLFPGSETATAAVIRRDAQPRSPYYLASSLSVRAFIGPKDYDILNGLGGNAKKLVRFGTFGFFAEILFFTIKAIHKVIPNWGWAIIVLTLFIKIIFFPLTYKSTKSMAKMAEIQPKIKALRAKYKKAKQDIGQRRQMNEEMMQLYKQHGVNPAGGCLPLLIQIPFFFGIFSMLRVAIEFRHSPWILWIGDLSIRDPLYITPILMGITQFISQKMTPTGADPAQARIMLIMPFVMTIFFMNFQSGLVLYWLTTNVLQIGQQMIMNRMMQKKKVETHGKPKFK